MNPMSEKVKMDKFLFARDSTLIPVTLEYDPSYRELFKTRDDMIKFSKDYIRDRVNVPESKFNSNGDLIVERIHLFADRGIFRTEVKMTMIQHSTSRVMEYKKNRNTKKEVAKDGLRSENVHG